MPKLDPSIRNLLGYGSSWEDAREGGGGGGKGVGGRGGIADFAEAESELERGRELGGLKPL